MLLSQREHKIHLFELLCDVLFIIETMKLRAEVVLEKRGLIQKLYKLH